MSGQTNQGEFHRADPAYRRQMKILLAVTVVIGLIFLVALHFWLGKLGEAAAHGELFVYERWLHRLLGGLCAMLAVASAVFALWLFRISAATRTARRWPPSSLRTSADVRIRYLTSADSLVTQMRGGAFVLLLLALALGGWAIWLFLTA